MSNLNAEENTLIGVHVRRGDYIPYARTYYHSEVPDEKFYFAAFQYYASK